MAYYYSVIRDKFPTPMNWDTEDQKTVWLFICDSDFESTIPAWVDASSDSSAREAYVSSVAFEASEYFETILEPAAIAQVFDRLVSFAA